MTCEVLIVGMPSAAGCASTKTWRAAAEYVHTRLVERFGPVVSFEYAELFSRDMERHAEFETLVARGTLPPIVAIDGVPRFIGGKLNVSAIERAVAEALAARTLVPSPVEAPQP